MSTYDLVDQVLGDPRLFSSVGAERRHIEMLDPAVRADVPILGDHFGAAQLNITDPPDHTRIRRAFGRSFVPREIDRYSDPIRSITSRLLDNATRTQAVVDLVRDLAEPLPVQVVGEIIGIPEPERASIPLVTLDQRFFFGQSPPDGERALRFAQSLSKWRDLLASWLDERRTNPTDDVMTRAAAMIDEGRITLDEAIATCLHLIIAGNGTTTALIGNTAFLLMSQPDQLLEVQQDPALIPNAIEESLRFEAPLPTDRRITTEACELGGQRIDKGDRVVAVLASANRDPAHFVDPDRFDVRRSFTSAQHAAFGRGIHLCLGAPVARLETKIAIEEILRRFPSPSLVPGFQPEWHSITTHRGMRSLPIGASSTSRVT